MSESHSSREMLRALVSASAALSARKDEVNRLNVFPVPDGDTGTNMSLTLESVAKAASNQPASATTAERRRALVNGALMGARGNSGVISSQILRGLLEGLGEHDELTTESLDDAFARAQEVAFAAVRKPVEGTILTVLRDCAAATKKARKKKMPTDEALDFLVESAHASIERTPELLPVLKEHGVVDAGGFGLYILIDAFVASILGRAQQPEETAFAHTPANNAQKGLPVIELAQDWEGSAFRYCTEFLFFSEVVDVDEGIDFLATMGDCELFVGAHPNFKVHVHTNTPDKVLHWMLERGQISEVHIHNMQLQSEERNERLAAEAHQGEGGSSASAAPAPHKPIGVVAVAPGEGNAAILKSMGVDVVISGGQTMNPSTQDILTAAESIDCDGVIVLPNNKNIILAANSAAQLSERPIEVVPTRSVPEAFAALFAFDGDEPLSEVASEMAEAAREVVTGEVTVAVKDSHAADGSPIRSGDVIGIAQGEILAVAATVEDATFKLLEAMDADDMDNLTLLAGADLSAERFEALTEAIEERYADLDVDAHVGGQELYPLVFSLE